MSEYTADELEQMLREVCQRLEANGIMMPKRVAKWWVQDQEMREARDERS